jgi:hypothetical protein
MAVEQLGPSEVQKLRELLQESLKVRQECDDLKSSLSETISCISEELSIPKKYISKAIQIAYKGKFSDSEEELAQIGEILSKTGFKD